MLTSLDDVLDSKARLGRGYVLVARNRNSEAPRSTQVGFTSGFHELERWLRRFVRLSRDHDLQGLSAQDVPGKAAPTRGI